VQFIHKYLIIKFNRTKEVEAKRSELRKKGLCIIFQLVMVTLVDTCAPGYFERSLEPNYSIGSWF